MKPLTILVTGSSGFLASYLVPMLFKKGHQVIGLDKKPRDKNLPYLSRFIEHDLKTPYPFAPLQFDLCLHLASEAGGFLRNSTQTALIDFEFQMIKNVRALCEKAHCSKIIFTSSINVFETSGVQKEDKLTTLNQSTPYALSKAQTEDYIQNNFESFTIIRPTNYFGKDQPTHGSQFGESHVIPDLIEKIKTKPIVEVFGDGTQIRNFLHAHDLARLITMTLHKENLSFVHVRSDLFLSIGELALKLMHFMNCQKPIRYLTEYLNYETSPIKPFSLTRAKRLGWEPRVTQLYDGLRLSPASHSPEPASISKIKRSILTNQF